MNTETIFLAKMQQAITLLNEIDDMIENNPEQQSNVDSELSDYFHLLENKHNELSDEGKLKIEENIVKCRIIRRNLNNIFELSKTYNVNRDKLKYKNQRQFLVSIMGNAVKKLHNDYKYRVLDEKSIDELCGVKKEITEEHKKPGKKPCISKEDLKEKIDKGMKLKDIAAELNVSNGTITHLRKQYGIENGGYKKRGMQDVKMEQY